MSFTKLINGELVVMSASEVAALPAVVNPVDTYLPLTKVQFWLAALGVGVTKAGVLALINQMTDETAKARALIMLEETTMYKRNDPFVIQFSTMMGITSTQLDQLWLQAAAL